MNLQARIPRKSSVVFCMAFACAFIAGASHSPAQAVNLFPADYQSQWTRIAIPPTHPVSDIAQWHIDAAKGEIKCDGNGGHEWLRFNRELGDFTFHVKWGFIPQAGTPAYNSGVFFRNDEQGVIWHQAQTSTGGGYIFGETPVNGKLTAFNLQKDMKENRLHAPGQWNTYDIRCSGPTCALKVNGEVVNTVQTGIVKGYIGLESEGFPIVFKDLKVRELH